MATVILKSGHEMPEPLVLATMHTLRRLMESAPMAVFDAVEMARTGRSPSPYSAARLEALGLTEYGRLHDGIRDIILSSARGAGLELRLTDPIA